VELSRLGAASLSFAEQFERIGPAPDAIMLHHPLKGGSVEGPGLRGRLLPRGGEWSTIRADGLVAVDARCILEAPDDQLVFINYVGTCDIGEDGYDALLDGEPLDYAWLDITLQFHSSAHEYRWLNRVLCFGTGKRDYARFTLDFSVCTVPHEPQRRG